MTHNASGAVMTHRLSALLVCALAAALGCRYQPVVASGQIEPLQHGAYRFSADIWAGAPLSALAQPKILRIGLDSVGRFAGTVTLPNDYNDADVDLDSLADGPGCTNRGVRDIVTNPQNPMRAEWFPHLLPGGGGNALVFRCPGLGLRKELTVVLFVSLQDPAGNSGWYMVRQQQSECTPPGERAGVASAPACPLLLGGRLVMSPVTSGVR